MASALRPNHQYAGPVREILRAKIHLLVISLLLQVLGACVLLPHSATVLTNYFAKNHAHGGIECTGLVAGEEPPKACKRAHDDVMWWNAAKSFLCFAVFGTLLTPVLCRWSDYYGRKPLLIFGMLIGFPPLLIFIAHLLFDLPLWWYYPASVLSESFVGSVLGFAYVSDVISPANRTAAFGILVAPFGAALIVGTLPTSLGWLKSPLTASLVALALVALGLLVLVFFVPESLSQKSMEIARAARGLNGGAKRRWCGAALDFWTSFKILFRTKYFFKLAVCLVLVSMIFEETAEIELQYLQEVAGFGTQDQAAAIAFTGVGTLFVQAVGMWFLVSVMRMSNKSLILVGLTAFFSKMVLMAFCSTKIVAYIAILSGTPVSVIVPATAAIKASYVSNDEQGALQGALGGAKSFAAGVGPFLFWVIFYFSRQGSLYYPGAPYVVCGLMILGAIVLAATIHLPAAINAASAEGIEFTERRGPDPKEAEGLLEAQGDDVLDKDDVVPL